MASSQKTEHDGKWESTEYVDSDDGTNQLEFGFVADLDEKPDATDDE